MTTLWESYRKRMWRTNANAPFWSSVVLHNSSLHNRSWKTLCPLLHIRRPISQGSLSTALFKPTHAGSCVRGFVQGWDVSIYFTRAAASSLNPTAVLMRPMISELLRTVSPCMSVQMQVCVCRCAECVWLPPSFLCLLCLHWTFIARCKLPEQRESISQRCTVGWILSQCSSHRFLMIVHHFPSLTRCQIVFAAFICGSCSIWFEPGKRQSWRMCVCACVSTKQ